MAFEFGDLSANGGLGCPQDFCRSRKRAVFSGRQKGTDVVPVEIVTLPIHTNLYNIQTKLLEASNDDCDNYSPVTQNNTPNQTEARLAGLFYLIPMFVGPFAMMIVPSNIVVKDNPAETWAHLVVGQGLMRAGIVGHLAIVLSEIVISVMLYRIMMHAGKVTAMVSMLSRFSMAVLQAVNVAPLLMTLLLVGKMQPAGANETNVAIEITYSCFALHAQVVHIWEVLFAFHGVLMAWLMVRSAYFPGWVALLVGMASVGYGVNGLGNLVYPSAESVFATLVMITALFGEVPFVFWLIGKGIRTPNVTDRASSEVGSAAVLARSLGVGMCEIFQGLISLGAVFRRARRSRKSLFGYLS